MTATDDSWILLVEDDPDQVELALHVFKTKGIDVPVQVVRDGEEALDLLLGRGPHAGEDGALEALRLILLDIKIPRVNGLEVLRIVRQSDRLRAVPIVVMTSSADVRDVEDSYRWGANSFIVKPPSFEEFSDVISRVTSYWMTYNVVPTT